MADFPHLQIFKWYFFRFIILSPNVFLPCAFINETAAAAVLGWDVRNAALTWQQRLSPPQYIYEDAKLLLKPFKVKEFLKE